jgi:hypothetical protein
MAGRAQADCEGEEGEPTREVHWFISGAKTTERVETSSSTSTLQNIVGDTANT